jgi:hypothetical protein
MLVQIGMMKAIVSRRRGGRAPSRPAYMPWLQAMPATGKSGGLVYAGQVSISTARSREWRGRANASPSSAARTATRSACCTVQTVIDQPDVARAIGWHSGEERMTVSSARLFYQLLTITRQPDPADPCSRSPLAKSRTHDHEMVGAIGRAGPVRMQLKSTSPGLATSSFRLGWSGS